MNRLSNINKIRRITVLSKYHGKVPLRNYNKPKIMNRQLIPKYLTVNDISSLKNNIENEINRSSEGLYNRIMGTSLLILSVCLGVLIK
jgi:hypothetical protein